MNEDLIQKLIDMVQNMAPSLWVMGSGRVVAYQFADAMFALLGLAVILISIWVHNGRRMANDTARIVLYCFGVVSTLLVFMNTTSFIMRLMSWDWYVLYVLIDLVK
jgi:hypothetical protein